MIVGSLLLIVIAVGLLVVGLLQGANALLVASIAASLLAAIALFFPVCRERKSASSRSRVSASRRDNSPPDTAVRKRAKR